MTTDAKPQPTPSRPPSRAYCGDCGEFQPIVAYPTPGGREGYFWLACEACSLILVTVLYDAPTEGSGPR